MTDNLKPEFEEARRKATLEHEFGETSLWAAASVNFSRPYRQCFEDNLTIARDHFKVAAEARKVYMPPFQRTLLTCRDNFLILRTRLGLWNK